MTAKSRILLVVSIILLLGAAFALVFRYVEVEHNRVLSYDDVTGMPAVSASYHSINNWATVEDTDFTGVPLYQVLEKVGVTDGVVQIQVIAPDGYFWPAVDDTLTLDELRTPNQQGLYALLAWEMNGETLQPEPDGSGPLRLVLPQYGEEEVNKPSWVSNVRLLLVGPLEEGYQAPDAGEVPVEEVRIGGNVPPGYPYPLWPVVLMGIIGLLLLGEVAADKLRIRQMGPQKVAVLILVATVFSVSLAMMEADRAVAESPQAVFSLEELRSMPASGGHYTFLKSQEPFTYYEEDYEGVSLSYLLQGATQLEPGADGVVVRCTDGYKVSLSLSQAVQVYPGGLQAIIAYSKRGESFKGDEGPLRLIVPQASPGDKAGGGDANTPYCARMVYAVEVTPLPAGLTPPSAASVPAGSLAVYGAVTVPAAPEQPAVTPPLEPVEETTTQANVETPANNIAVTPAATEFTLNGLPPSLSRLVLGVTLAGGPYPLTMQLWIASESERGPS